MPSAHQLERDFGLHDGLDTAHVENIARLGANLTRCARVLDSAGHGELPVDDGVLALLADCEREAQDIADDDPGSDDAAVSDERLATLRIIYDLATDRVGERGSVNGPTR
jgi:hypothetical protein